MTNKRGVSLVELLVTMIVAAILMLIVGVLSELALSTSRELRQEAEVFNDIMYGFKMAQKRIREGNNCIILSSTGGEKLECQNELIGIFDNSGKYQLVYMENKNGSKQDLLIETPSGDMSLDFTKPLNSDAITVKIEGEKDGFPFELESTVTKR